MADSGVLTAFRFQVSSEVPLGGFSECGGLQLETEVQDYPEGGQNAYVHKLPGRVKQTNLRLKRGLATQALWDWYAAILDGDIARRSVSVRLLDGTRSVRAEWRLFRAYPVKWIGPDLNATQNQVAAETIELVHEGIQKG